MRNNNHEIVKQQRKQKKLKLEIKKIKKNLPKHIIGLVLTLAVLLFLSQNSIHKYFGNVTSFLKYCIFIFCIIIIILLMRKFVKIIKKKKEIKNIGYKLYQLMKLDLND